MPVDRPTFSESWYRVIELRPRLRNSVQVHRQFYRGQIWYVLQDPANNQFYRLNTAAYHFVGMLDGRRNVGTVWQACNEELGDEAPTQGEAIQLLGQLYTSNLIQADLPPDTAGMFQRYKQRKTREISGYLMNILFARFPVYDPDHFLNRWVGLVGWVFGSVGTLLWVIMIGLGLYSLAGHWDALVTEGKAADLLTPENLPWLYVSMAVIKALHEFGHAFACKRFGVRNGSGGEVHVMGIMMLVFTPMPYVDASSSWAFDSKWQRIVVGLGGMLVELFIAAIAAVVWAHTSSYHAVHAIAFNIIFVAGVSTLLFNGNPLLRYDGYYVLADLLEIPNLWQRSREYLYYIVKKYVWGVRRPRCPSQQPGEKFWLFVYSIASTIYRAFVCVAIILYVAGALPMMGLVLAIAAVAAWLCVPLVKFIHYLLANQELMRCRFRAIATTSAFVLALLAVIGLIPVGDHVRADAVVRPIQEKVVYAKTDSFLTSYLPSGELVACSCTGGALPVLFTGTNTQLVRERENVLAEKKKIDAQMLLEQTRDRGTYQGLQLVSKSLDRRLQHVQEQLDNLSVVAPFPGQWVAPLLDQRKGAFVKEGQAVGLMVNTCALQLEAAVGQNDGPRLIAEGNQQVELRLPGLAGQRFTGKISREIRAAQKTGMDPALTTAANGAFAMDPHGKGETVDPYFQVMIEPQADAPKLYPGQRVSVRFDLAEKPLAMKWYNSLMQLLQQRFKV